MARNKVGRNDPCPCGSGKKYKNCCEGKTRLSPANWAAIVAVILAAGMLAYFLVNVSLGRGNAGRSCPPGQVWSQAHGHCHDPLQQRAPSGGGPGTCPAGQTWSAAHGHCH